MLIIVQAIFGFGVGGEFPVAASAASERAEETKAKRGCTVQLVFAMQVGLPPNPNFKPTMTASHVILLICFSSRDRCQSRSCDTVNEDNEGACSLAA